MIIVTSKSSLRHCRLYAFTVCLTLNDERYEIRVVFGKNKKVQQWSELEKPKYAVVNIKRRMAARENVRNKKYCVLIVFVTKQIRISNSAT